MMTDLKLKPGTYAPETGISYPADPWERIVKVEVEDSARGKYQFDETYPYLDDSFHYKWNKFLGIFVQGIAYLWNRIHFGLRVEGRQNLKGYRKQLSGGAMCVCNHVFVFDALSVYQALNPFRQLRIPMFAKHFNGKKGWFMRYVGGVPLPETRGGMEKFIEAFDEFHRRGEWMLVFPESVRWDWYVPVRPFKPGAFAMAYKYSIPVVPLAISYRPRRGLYRLFGGPSLPCATIHVGQPLLTDRSVDRKTETERLCRESHRRIVDMAGIEQNPWPAIR